LAARSCPAPAKCLTRESGVNKELLKSLGGKKAGILHPICFIPKLHQRVRTIVTVSETQRRLSLAVVLTSKICYIRHYGVLLRKTSL